MAILIIEDEPLAAERLKILLAESELQLPVAGILDSVSAAQAWLAEKNEVSLIFMDVELADGQCFPILDHIPDTCPVVFTTAYDEFALKAFQHLCLDYLVKPISRKALARAVARFKTWQGQQKQPVIEQDPLAEIENHRERFLVKNGSRMVFLHHSEIAYFFADGKNVFVVSREGQRYPIDLTLEKLERSLDPSRFFRFNRKVIGSVDAIRDIRTYVNSRLRISLLAGKLADEAIVSRERVQAFRQWAGAC